MKALKDSFHPEIINLIETTRRTTTTQSSPTKKGQEFHQILAKQIKMGTRKGIEGAILEETEKKFRCKFIEADVKISGFAVNGKTQDFWIGEMDAVAIRREKGVLEVFVVDWKTSAKTDEQLIHKWWENSSNFKKPLYQCLVYRELLQAHLKRNKVDANVGIILVPFHQLFPEIIRPGLCVDFGRMEKLLYFDRLKKFEWYAVLDESFDVHTIKMPCFDLADYVDESTNILKDDTPLKDILDVANATVGDLRRLLHLPLIKIESTKKEEKTRNLSR